MTEKQRDQFMQRCFQLAEKADNRVAGNPVVGCVIVHGDRIIGEGYHAVSGGPHAEVVAIESIPTEGRSLLKKSKLFVSLEPCNHWGKTGPCVEAITKAGIPEVYVSCHDPNPEMRGKSIELLRARGVMVSDHILESDGKKLIKRFAINQLLNLPYIVLKYAESKDHFIGRENQKVKISNRHTDYLVQSYRSKLQAIMVGTQTAIVDNPRLTCRLPGASSPLRIVLDRSERIPKTHHLLSDELPTMVLSSVPEYSFPGQKKELLLIEQEAWDPETIFRRLYKLGISSILVEGGAQWLQSVINAGFWQEALLIRSSNKLSTGIKAPVLKARLKETRSIGDDQLYFLENERYNNLNW